MLMYLEEPTWSVSTLSNFTMIFAVLQLLVAIWLLECELAGSSALLIRCYTCCSLRVELQQWGWCGTYSTLILGGSELQTGKKSACSMNLKQGN